MILLGLGANLPSRVGDPVNTLRAALHQLETVRILPLKSSHLFVSEAWPDPNDPPYANMVTQVDTDLDPQALLARVHEIEAKFGRQRGVRNAPRTLDIDLLDYEGRLSEGPPRLPHPRMGERGFVLIPLAEIAPGWRHPVSGRSVEALIAGLKPAQRNVRRLDA